MCSHRRAPSPANAGPWVFASTARPPLVSNVLARRPTPPSAGRPASLIAHATTQAGYATDAACAATLQRPSELSYQHDGHMQPLSAVHAAPAQLSTAQRNHIGKTTCQYEFPNLATAIPRSIVFALSHHRRSKGACPFDSALSESGLATRRHGHAAHCCTLSGSST